MNIVQRHPIISSVIIAIVVMTIGAMDYAVITREAPTHEVIYARPPMAAPCREPKVGEELRIWVDKRTSDKEGVRTCRVVPITGDDSPRKAIRGVLKQKGIWL